MSDADRRELRLAAMLHDCGKIATPVHVVDKATKLSTIFDRIALVEARFDLAEREARIELLEAHRRGEPRPAAESRYRETISALAAERRFVREANRGSERMREEDVARVRAIAARRLRDGSGEERPLLTEDEVGNLTIRAGTLNPSEREIINRHVTTTIRMLEALPWPRQLARVPEYAGAHHERVDGDGLPARPHARADVVAGADRRDRRRVRGADRRRSALQAGAIDRPKSLAILERMKTSGHVDPDLFDLFVRERVYAITRASSSIRRRLAESTRRHQLPVSPPLAAALRPDVRPALLLALHDLDHAGADVADRRPACRAA